MEVIHMARQRTVKDPPKRGNLTKAQIKRAVQVVVNKKKNAKKATTSSQNKK